LSGDSYINRGIKLIDDFLGVWGMWGCNNEVKVVAMLRRVVLMAFRKPPQLAGCSCGGHKSGHVQTWLERVSQLGVVLAWFMLDAGQCKPCLRG
jgi:hypothetical protein